MVRVSVMIYTENGAFQDSGLTFVVGMIVASISVMSIVIFACAKSSEKRKNKNNPYSDGGGGDKTFAKTVVISGSKARNKHATGEILVSGAEISVDIPATDDVCDNNNSDKDTRCYGGDTTKNTGGDDGSKNNDVHNGDNHAIVNSNHGHTHDHNNNHMGGGHTHASTEITSHGGGHHHDYTSTGNTGGGGGGWSSDHGGSSWSGGGDTGGFGGGGW